MGKTRVILIVAITVFILLDIFLITKLFRDNRKFKSHSPENLSSKYYEGNINEGVLPTVRVNSVITDDPFLNKETGDFELNIKFDINKKNVRGTLILGKSDDWALILKAKEGSLNSEKQEWKKQNISDFINLLKKGDPIIVKFNSIIPESLIKDPNCDEACEDRLIKRREKSKDNLKIANALTINGVVNSPVKIGAITSLTIYVD